MPIHKGLKNQPAVIILNNLELSIKHSDQPGEHNIGAVVKISPMVGLDDIVDAV
jgi:hypothetical protein